MEVAPRSHRYAILRALIELDNADRNNFDVWWWLTEWQNTASMYYPGYYLWNKNFWLTSILQLATDELSLVSPNICILINHLMCYHVCGINLVPRLLPHFSARKEPGYETMLYSIMSSLSLSVVMAGFLQPKE